MSESQFALSYFLPCARSSADVTWDQPIGFSGFTPAEGLGPSLQGSSFWLFLTHLAFYHSHHMPDLWQLPNDVSPLTPMDIVISWGSDPGLFFKEKPLICVRTFVIKNVYDKNKHYILEVAVYSSLVPFQKPCRQTNLHVADDIFHGLQKCLHSQNLVPRLKHYQGACFKESGGVHPGFYPKPASQNH